MMIDSASHYLFCYTSKPNQNLNKNHLNKSCDDFNVGHSALPAWATFNFNVAHAGNIAYW